ncbi:MAG: HAD family phosphatase [Chloroflexota bacterium]
MANNIPEIKAVIFDIGGVLIRTEDRSHRNHLEDRLGLKRGESEILVFNGEMGKKAQRGEITSAELYGWIQDHLGLDQVGINQFKTEFWAGDYLDQELVKYIRQLRQKYTVCIISNFMDALPQMLKSDYPAADAFHFTVVSAHVGTMKPHRKIFDYTIKLLNLRPEETVFIDDFRHNIEGCQAVGMHGILFTLQIDLKAELEELGVKL